MASEKNISGEAYPTGTLAIEMAVERSIQDATELAKNKLWKPAQLKTLASIKTDLETVLESILALKEAYVKVKKEEATQATETKKK